MNFNGQKYSSLRGLIILLPLFLLAILIGCGGGGSGGSDGGDSGDITSETVNILDRAVFVNPTDPMLYSFSTEDGQQLTYFGRRNETGLASVITMLEYLDETGNTYDIYYDSQGLPFKVSDQEGTTIEFEYISTNSNVMANIRSLPLEDGLTSIDVMGVNVIMLTSGIPVPLEVKTRVGLVQPVSVDLGSVNSEIRPQHPDFNVVINVSHCGEPFKPKGGVTLNYRRALYQQKTRIPAEMTSEIGQFVASIPTREPDKVPANLEAACTAIADKINLVCNIVNPALAPGAPKLTDENIYIPLCTQVGLVATPKAGLACLALFTAGKIGCATLAIGGSAPDEDNLTQKLCDQVEEALDSIDSAIDSLGPDSSKTVYIQAWADFSPMIAHSPAELEVSPFGPFPIELEINSWEPMVGDLTISPWPEVGQGYLATVEMLCVSGADLSIEVSRDGSPLVNPEPKYAFNSTEIISQPVPARPSGDTDRLLVSAKYDPALQLSGASKEFSVKFSEAQDQTDWGIGGMIGWEWQHAKEECEKNGEHLPTIAQLRQAYSECLTERGLPQGANCVPFNFYAWRYYWSSEESGNTAAAFYFGDAGEGNDGGKVWADARKDKNLDAVCVRSH
jgi:hypothetical protein